MTTINQTPPAPPAANPSRKVEVLERAVIRFSGDSGDGMQITGTQFTQTTGAMGNDLATFPDYPAEIRAPAGTVAGVSGFQINFASNDVYTPGDQIDALVAMNPAALKANLGDLRKAGVLIVNTDAFRPNDLEKAGLKSNPLEDHSLDGYRVFPVEITRLTRAALKELGLGAKETDRCKNFFALGMCYWLYNRAPEGSIKWLDEKFKGEKAVFAQANKLAMLAGHSYCDVTEAFQVRYEIPPAKLPAGLYRNISGNQATALGLVAAAERAKLPLFLGSYPITPASEILHELSYFKDFGVITFQAEDEIAAVAAAIGASFSGVLAVTTSSGPGIALKQEAIGLAVIAELPLVIIDVQRGGPSTGLPTKTEQADLFQVLLGRNSECPLPVIAPSGSADCFWAATEACRLALKYMTPVVMLSDGYVANGTEPWRIPAESELPEIPVKFTTNPEGFKSYKREPGTLARPWAIPGTPGLEHRIGGLEKDESGRVSHDPMNHEHMVRTRAAKVEAVAQDIPDVVPAGHAQGDLAIVSWGSTYGSITAAVRAQVADGKKVGHIHLKHLNPFPRNLGDVLKRFKHVLVAEMNMGQLLMLLRAKYLVDAKPLTKVQGKPFTQAEIESRINEVLA